MPIRNTERQHQDWMYTEKGHLHISDPVGVAAGSESPPKVQKKFVVNTHTLSWDEPGTASVDCVGEF